jgi:predicted aminopeptidase
MVHRSFPKAAPVRSEAYRRAVATLPCWFCGVHLHTQAAHGDEGKGGMLKSNDLTCWPGCGPHDGLPGCHYIMGSTGSFTQSERRAMEVMAARHTQYTLIALAVSDHKLRRVLVTVGLLP